MNATPKTDRYERARRQNTLYITLAGGLFAAAIVAGMIYFYYKTVPRF
jgi:hypothetical protein